MSLSSGQDTATVGEALQHARKLLARHPAAAAQQARQIIAAEPGIAETYLILAAALRAEGQADDALAAEQDAVRVSIADPVLRRAAEYLGSGRGHEGERLIRRLLEDSPNDPGALRLLGQVAARAGHLEQAEQLVRRCLMLVPSFAAAQADLGAIVAQQARDYTGLGERAQETPPAGVDEFADAIRHYEQTLAKSPADSKAWLGFGHVLRIAGRPQDSMMAYRKAIELEPTFGEAWWSLVDLKTVVLTGEEIDRLRAALDRPDLADVDRAGLYFSLGKGLGDCGEYAASFEAYAQGNRLKRLAVSYDPVALDDFVRESKTLFSSEFFASRAGQGYPASDPIFIVGMPRSGSTLLEQILASHPLIEGTEELVYIGNLAMLFSKGRRPGVETSEFINGLTSAGTDKLKSIGGAYLWKASKQRRSNRPHFVDKMPRNWIYLPLILLALPNAKIIDARRNPMDCCWSNYRQMFADSGEFSYDLQELAGYYRIYVEMMQHIDDVLPGRVHRVIYEQLVENSEQEVRALLEYIGVPFDEACLRFQDNPRSVKTSSSEQVRRPISGDFVGQWRPYEPWLQPLEKELGPIIDCYPLVPAKLR